ncbi:MAG TPA: hypothetical protein DGH68_09915 [Bacteroidetes bacterium]|jgi:hypothetical protein|nr:hypothetical protein [Bacteroidota bacterium]
MLEILDAIIATGGVILALSLIVQAIQQIIKQMFDLKSSYMRSELLALFSSSGTLGFFASNWKSVGRLAKGADAVATRIVQELEEKIASFGYKDLELLEDVSTEKLKQYVMTLPIAEDGVFHKEFQLALNEIDRWFEVSKKAFQDHYERRMKLWSFMISAIVVIGLNSNLFVVYQDFATNKTTRVAAVAWTEKVVNEHKTPDSLKSGTAVDAAKAESVATAIIRADLADIKMYINEQSLQLCRWNTARGDSMHLLTPKLAFITQAPCDLWNAATKNFFGWLGMTLLVSLGSPFWYDFLKAIMGVKESLKSKKQTPTE